MIKNKLIEQKIYNLRDYKKSVAYYGDRFFVHLPLYCSKTLKCKNING